MAGVGEDTFQDYMDGGLIRRYRRPVARRPVAKRPATKRPVARRPAAKNMTRLFGGFFESLEHFAKEEKEEKKTSTSGTSGTTSTSGSEERYMEELKRGGAKHRMKKPVKKVKKPVKMVKKGGYEVDQEQEDFSSSGISSAISSILSGGAFRRSPRRVPKRPVAKRPVAKRPVRRSASPARRMRFM
jgi:hypothetical protein